MAIKPKIILNCTYLQTRELRPSAGELPREDLKIDKLEIT